MTNERAKEAARNILMTLPTSDSGHYYHDDLVQAIAADIAARERARWDGLKVTNAQLEWALKELGPTGTNAEAYIKAAVLHVIFRRQQGEAVKPIPAPEEG